MANFLQQVVSGLASGGIYGSLALAIVLIHRATGVINFAQGEFATLSAFVCWTLIDHGWAFWPAFGATLVLSFLGGVAFSKQDLGVIVVAFVALGLVGVLFTRTRLGLGLRAAAVNPFESRLAGIRVSRMLALGWGLAAVLGAIAGVMAAPSLFLEPNMMQTVLLYAFAAAVLGGMDSPLGAVVGGLLLGVLLNLVGTYVHWIGGELRLAVALAVILSVLLVRPAGLFGRVAVRRA